MTMGGCARIDFGDGSSASLVGLSMLRYGSDYIHAGQQAYERQYRDRVLTNLQRQAKVLGYQLVQVEDTDGGVGSML